MDAQTCILTRRSVRKFTGEKVSRQEIEKIVSLAAYAPSWKNTQISRYIAIERCEGWQYYDCGIAAQTFCLAAHDLGLATVIMGVFDRKGLQEYLQVPEDQELMALIALGHPADQPQPPKRKDTDLLLSYR